MKKYILLTALLTVFNVTQAEIIPPPKSGIDERIRQIDYTRDVIRLNTFVGVSSHIEFGDDEYIEFIASGDDEAWHFAPKRNHLFIRPISTEFTDTNLTVLTNKYTYHFVLMQNALDSPENWSEAWQDRNLVYSLRFNYPLEQAEALRKQKQAEDAIRAENNRIAKLQREKLELEKALDKANEKINNLNYWKAGDEDIAPLRMYDDGNFTYLTFAPNQSIPAIYSLNKHGEEGIVNTTMINKSTIKIHSVYQNLRLRSGKSVLCVQNRGFSLPSEMRTNTTSDKVLRQVRRSL